MSAQSEVTTSATPAHRARAPVEAPTRSTRAHAAAGLSELPDAELLVLVGLREVAALEAVYDRHIDAVWRGALKLTADAATAERAVAAAFMTVWTRPAPAEDGGLVARLLAAVWRDVRAPREPIGG